MKRPMKIAVYSGEIPSTTFIERLIHGLERSDCHVLLFGVKASNHYPNKKNVKNFGYRNNRFFKIVYLLSYWLRLTIFRNRDKKRLHLKLKKLSRYHLNVLIKVYPVLWYKPDIFHIQWAKGIQDWMWVQDFGIKIILSLRGAHINYSPLADRNLAEVYKQNFPKLDAFHAVSNAIGKEAVIYGADKNKILTILSGLDLKSFPFSKRRSKSPVFRILSIGRDHWKKGYHYSLDACSKLKNQGMDFHYQIVGLNPDFEVLYQLKDSNLESHVKIESHLPMDLVRFYIQEADVLLLPSIEEGIANVVLEAMALGTLVVSSDCGGMNEVIEHKVNGLLVAVRDPEAIAEALKEVSEMTDSTYETIVMNARDTIERQHDIEEMINKMIGLYSKTLFFDK